MPAQRFSGTITGTLSDCSLTMPKIVPALTDTSIRQAKPTDKPRRLFDGKQVGLHILIQPSGAKLWRLRYTFEGEEKRIALGKYPEVSLEEVRNTAGAFREQIRLGIDPAAPVSVNTFAAISEKFVEWKTTEHQREPATIRKYNECLRNDLLPALGNKDIKDIHTREVVTLLESINKRSNSLASKNQKLVSMIIKFAIQRGYREPYTNLDLAGLIKQKKPPVKKTLADIKDTFLKIDTYSEIVMRFAMKLQFLCFLRSSETVGAEWREIDFEKKEWHVPAERMKMRRPHVVPLSRQAINLLKDLKKTIGEDEKYLFPSGDKKGNHLVRDALSKAFRSTNLGVVPHGTRTVAATWLRNAGYAPHLVETQLSHAESNAVAAAYQSEPHLLYLKERHQMMQAWADYLFSKTSSRQPTA